MLFLPHLIRHHRKTFRRIPRHTKPRSRRRDNIPIRERRCLRRARYIAEWLLEEGEIRPRRGALSWLWKSVGARHIYTPFRRCSEPQFGLARIF